ncbi:hypothetical protein ScalyP_jg10336 [Parmales sp. scaly parma]|nr:hypothetical protein ScalyP_jg10336 [Parmales sp. scaly parma]
MSANHTIAKNTNVERRTWDKEKYNKLASERAASNTDEASDFYKKKERQEAIANANKEEFQSADETAAGPTGSKRAFLKARTSKIDLDSKVGSTEIIMDSAPPLTNSDVVKKSNDGVGWFCEVCECSLKDSMTYLDHINGKKHQRALGFSMRVEQSSVESVKDKLLKLKKSQSKFEGEVEAEEGGGVGESV